MNKTEQRYHSNKQEFLALKWAITEQFHEYLSPYGKNRNEFVVCTDNNPLTYIFSSVNLDAAGQRWVARLASYNFSLEYQKGKDNTVADFLSQMNERLPEKEVQEYLNQILYPGSRLYSTTLSCPSKSVLSKESGRLPTVKVITRKRQWRLGQQGWPPPTSLTGNKNKRRTQSSIRLPNT